jgi:hypothetical protein
MKSLDGVNQKKKILRQLLNGYFESVVVRKVPMFLSSLVERYPPFYPRTDENALTIHYTKNTGEIGAEEMVLVDAGGVGTHLSTEG